MLALFPSHTVPSLLPAVRNVPVLFTECPELRGSAGSAPKGRPGGGVTVPALDDAAAADVAGGISADDAESLAAASAYIKMTILQRFYGEGGVLESWVLIVVCYFLPTASRPDRQSISRVLNR